MHRFYAHPEMICNGLIELGEDESRHLFNVLRLRAGSEAGVFDGQGHEYRCAVVSAERSKAVLRIVEAIQPPASESCLDLVLAAAMLKGENFDLVVQKSVELGVKRLIPLRTARCDIHAKDPARRVERWRKISLEASKQCGRSVVMTVDEPTDISGAILAAGPEIRCLMFSERGGSRLKNALDTTAVIAIVGPEGGWTDDEIEEARLAGLDIVTFGGRTLRAETAAIAVAAILQHRFGDLN